MSQYKIFLDNYLERINTEGRYRTFVDIERDCASPPYAFCKDTNSKVVLWCSNDYLGMGMHPKVTSAAIKALETYGIGAGGTRNISGNSSAIVELEKVLARLHNKQKALVFASGYVANQNSLFALAKIFQDLVFFSDADNHASIIAGINYSRAKKYIFAHNNIDSLRECLKQEDITKPKIIVFESIYSMDGSLAPIADICSLARQYNALTYLDEVHSVALYGASGAGMAEKLGLSQQIDIIQGTLGKGFGGVGGYLAAAIEVIEAIRLTAPGFIFTTAMPPLIAAGLKASIEYLMTSNDERIKHQANVAIFKSHLRAAKINFFDGGTHIIPIMIGDAKRAKVISESLLHQHQIYLQHINYPTVPKGAERLRVIITPHHTQEMMQDLIKALKGLGL
jgi:5-aminolevulinate synthase